MGDNVRVDQGDTGQQDAAVLLLAAAEELGLPAGVVTVDTLGPDGPSFSAPQEVVEKAGFKAEESPSEDVPDRLQGPTADFFADHEGEAKPEQGVATDETTGATVDPDNKPEPAKKTTAKKTAAKKTASKQE